jgi:hypothetical protein
MLVKKVCPNKTYSQVISTVWYKIQTIFTALLLKFSGG